ncbi:class I SAM-dependent methyltransferase [Candidatus Poribacteria bacterium]|nr:class I SAM-dependent methyltransferase [Candidatus Poribacteria bacterium]MBT5533038.1 class I SAM-dependent methyltransferase [Candidatus Poribacteria bacterium]MBT7097239.1 class I SAM-dependent methyltransferase [Candidatus Poribacteria bacterium]MBT7808094.1 class I SAM-dependent methyltransferase [Candidatus Poribacteria bacterium]
MRLIDLATRPPVPTPWEEGEQIPWDDPDFGRRMLREHLSQEHDAASRRAERIDASVSWIDSEMMDAQPGRILDLGCGPGLYASRLARLGHDVVGVDFSPVSLGYARETAARESLSCEYIKGDLREADYGAGFDLVMQIYGEINVFRPDDARRILSKAHGALRPGGRLLVELQRAEGVERNARAGNSWTLYREGGLFSDEPYVYLESAFWDSDMRVGTRRMDVVDAATGDVTCHALSNRAYSEAEFGDVLRACGFGSVEFRPVGGGLTGGDEDFVTVTSYRPGTS